MASTPRDLVTLGRSRAKNAPEAALWLREPYRVLFPLGFLLAWVGVLPWFVLGLGLSTSYRSVFHSMVQVEGTFMCFALGFLFTFVPRRTATFAASRTEVALACAGPLITTGAAWLERWMLAQLGWWIAVGTLITFVVRRARAARRQGGVTRLHAGFVWVPISFVASLLGSLLGGVAALGDPELMWIHDVGKDMLLQGLFTGLALGVGSLLLPVLTRGGDARLPDESAHRAAPLVHAALALLFFASFPLSRIVGDSTAFALRAAIVAAVLVGGAKLWRLPTERGLSRKLVWVSAWLIPIGFALTALLPAYRSAMLHVTFLGGFGLLTFTISSHVVLSHGGAPERTRQHPWQLAALALLFAGALAARVMVGLDPTHVARWLALASGLFLLGTLAWAMLTLPQIARSYGSAAQNAP